MPIAALLMLVLALIVDTTAIAGIHACPTASGGTQFQDRPCDSVPAAPTTARATSDRAASASVRALPAGMDKSWFEAPAEGNREALCDERGCECGSLERVFETGLPLAVADAMYLDGSWHRYDESVAAWQQATDPGDSFAARTELDDAACDVAMSQRTLVLFAERALNTLRRRARDAEDLGRDDVSACDGFSDAACQDYEAFMLYQRMLLDLRALTEPRLSMQDYVSLGTVQP